MRIDKSVFVHKMAFISGEVRIGKNSSVWPGAVIRGDFAPVTIGHSSVLHGCEIQDRVIIGMNATIMEGAKVARNSIIAANALVRENAIIPESSLVAGIPGEIKHRKTDSELIMRSALVYYELSRRYLKGEEIFPEDQVDKVIEIYKEKGLL